MFKHHVFVIIQLLLLLCHNLSAMSSLIVTLYEHSNSIIKCILIFRSKSIVMPAFGFKSRFGFEPGSCLLFRVQACACRPVFNSVQIS